MGYYESPPIIERAKSGELIAAGIERAAASIAGGIEAYAANVDKVKEARAKSLEKERTERNRIELLWNNKKDDWSEKKEKLGITIDKEIFDVVGKRIKDAADAEIALLSETSKPKRDELLATISLANKYIDNTTEAVKVLGGESVTYADGAGMYAQPGGYVINGTGDVIEKKTATMNIMNGRTQEYDDSSYNAVDDGEGGFNITAKWKKKGEPNYNEYQFNSREYLVSDKVADNSFLIKVPDRNKNIEQSSLKIYDKKADRIMDAYLSPTIETIDLPSEGKQMVLEGVRRLEMDLIKPAIDEESDIEATGWINGAKIPETRALVDVTLKKGRGYFDEEIAPLPIDQQRVKLKELLTENTLEALTAKLQTTREKDTDGKEVTVYWDSKGPDVRVKEKPKVISAKRGGGGKVSEASKNYAYAVEAVEKVMNRGQGTLFGTAERQLRVKDGIPTLWQYDKSIGDYMEIPLSEDQVRQGIDGLAASIGVYDRKRNKPFLTTKSKNKSKVNANSFGENKIKKSFLGKLQNTVELP
jgi:hypothetical protein